MPTKRGGSSGVSNVAAVTNAAPQASTAWDNGLPPDTDDSAPRNSGTTPTAEQARVDYVLSRIPGITEEQARIWAEAVHEFTDLEYENMRLWPDSDESKAAEDFIKAAPRWNGGYTYRGLNGDGMLANFPVGATNISMKGLASWSTDETMATRYASAFMNPAGADPTRCVVVTCKTQSKGTLVKGLSEYWSESEVMVSSEARYKVVQHIRHTGYTEVVVEEI